MKVNKKKVFKISLGILAVMIVWILFSALTYTDSSPYKDISWTEDLYNVEAIIKEDIGINPTESGMYTSGTLNAIKYEGISFENESFFNMENQGGNVEIHTQKNTQEPYEERETTVYFSEQYEFDGAIVNDTCESDSEYGMEKICTDLTELYGEPVHIDDYYVLFDSGNGYIRVGYGEIFESEPNFFIITVTYFNPMFDLDFLTSPNFQENLVKYCV